LVLIQTLIYSIDYQLKFEKNEHFCPTTTIKSFE
jgi:hypothetical protein